MSPEERRRGRAALKAEYGALYDQVSALLFEHDPMNINFETNTDEYEPEVDTILPRLAQCGSAVEVRRVVHEELVRWFDAKMAGPETRYDALAAEIWRAWRATRS